MADLSADLPAPQLTEDGKPFYVFTLRDDLKWSDGSALTAADFVYSWNRAFQDADTPERELFACVDGFASGSLNISASEDGKTLTVVLAKPTPRFLERLANPVFCPVQEAAVQTAGWDRSRSGASRAAPIRSAAFYEEGMTLTKNEHYWNAANTGLDSWILSFPRMPTPFSTATWKGAIAWRRVCRRASRRSCARARATRCT